jgi:hypothetical protein
MLNITRNIPDEKYSIKGIEKDEMEEAQAKKYLYPGYSEGIELKPKLPRIANKTTIVHIVPYSKASSFKKPIDDVFSGSQNML